MIKPRIQFVILYDTKKENNLKHLKGLGWTDRKFAEEELESILINQNRIKDAYGTKPKKFNFRIETEDITNKKYKK